MSRKSLSDRSILVTGGGYGIGAACAAMATKEGARVTICGRTENTLEQAAERIRGEGGNIHFTVADMTVEDDVIRAVGDAVEFGGGLHGVVANAGGGASLAPFHLQDIDIYTRVLRNNLVSTMLCVKHSVKPLAEAGGGSFVAMSSLAASIAHPFFGAYTSAKAGVNTMMRNAADEYGHAKVRFNAIEPSFTETEPMEGIQRGGPIWESFVSQTPMGGVGQPEDVANAVRFFLSDESRWITGQILAVDGGNGLRRGPDFSQAVIHMFGADAIPPASR